MNEAMVWLIVIIGCVIFLPFIGFCLREYDFKRQISGKRPERKADKEQEMSETQNMDIDTELIKEQAKIASRNQMRWR